MRQIAKGYKMEAISNLFHKLLLTLIFSWVSENITTPIQNFIYQNIEDAGLLTVSHCRRLNLRDLIRELKDAKYYLEGIKDLPTTDQVFLYHLEGITPGQYEFHTNQFNKTMQMIRLFVEKRTAYVFSRQHRQEIIELENEMRRIREVYDVMDDIIRCNHPLYTKRIKLKRVKDLTESESYEKIVMPEIIPLKYTK